MAAASKVWIVRLVDDCVQRFGKSVYITGRARAALRSINIVHGDSIRISTSWFQGAYTIRNLHDLNLWVFGDLPRFSLCAGGLKAILGIHTIPDVLYIRKVIKREKSC